MTTDYKDLPMPVALMIEEYTERFSKQCVAIYKRHGSLTINFESHLTDIANRDGIVERKPNDHYDFTITR